MLAEDSTGEQPPTHAKTHTLCEWAEQAAQQHTASQPTLPPARITREGKEQAQAMRTPIAARYRRERGDMSRRIIINETSLR